MSDKYFSENEFLVLAEGGLESFEAHLHEKEMLFGSSLRGRREDQRNLLVLCYPGPRQESDDFNEFFSSPDNLNPFCNSFCGVFAVELTDYVNDPENPKLAELFGFMRERKEMSFILFAVDDGSGAAVRLAEKTSGRIGCKVALATERGLEWKDGRESRSKSKSFGY